MNDRIWTDDEQAIREGGTRSQFQEQKHALETPEANRPAALNESVRRLERARQELSAAEAETVQSAGLVGEWESLLQRRDDLRQRVRNLSAVLAGYENEIPGTEAWLLDNLGHPFTHPAQIEPAFQRLAMAAQAVAVIPGLVEGKRKALADAEANVVKFAKEHGLEHLLGAQTGTNERPQRTK